VSFTKRLIKGTIQLGLGVVLLEAALLTGCASQSLFDKIPQSMGGLSPDAPARPVVTPAYPAVHDMPPARASEPLTDEQQKNEANDLQSLRDRVQRRGAEARTNDQSADQPATDPSKKAAKKKAPAKPTDSQTAGVKRNP